MMTLGDLRSGERFRKWDGATGTVVRVNYCRARVKLDGADPRRRIVTFESSKGSREVEFVDQRAGEMDLAPGTEVIEVLDR